MLIFEEMKDNIELIVIPSFVLSLLNPSRDVGRLLPHVPRVHDVEPGEHVAVPRLQPGHRARGVVHVILVPRHRGQRQRDGQRQEVPVISVFLSNFQVYYFLEAAGLLSAAQPSWRDRRYRR